MKPYTYALIAAAAACGLASAAETAYTTPVGYNTSNLVQGFNLVGLTVQSPTAVAGDLEAVASNSVTDTDVDFTTVLTAGSTYILEITSGAGSGTIQEITSWTANTLTTADDLTLAGVALDHLYKIRKAKTLEEVFGTTTSILKKGATAALSDIVWVPTATAGVYTRYFLNTSSAWRNAAGGAAPNVPLIYADGLFVEKKDAGTVSLVETGEVKLGGTNYVVLQGFNLIGTTFPAGSTLQNLGLEDDVKKGATAALSDIIWMPTGPGTYNRYFLNTSNAWRNAAGGAAPADLPITSALFLERKDAGSAGVDTTPPVSYSNL